MLPDTITERATSRPLRILLLTSDKYPPFRPAARVLFGDELGRLGHTVDWVMQTATQLDGTPPTQFGNGLLVLADTDDGTSRTRRLRKYWLDFKNDTKVLRLLRKHKYDIVQVKDKYVGAVLALVAARLFKVKFCYWLAYPHAEASLLEARTGVARFRFFYVIRGYFLTALLYKVILKHADHIFVQSEQMRRDIAAHGFNENRMTPVPSSLNLEELPPCSRYRSKPASSLKRIVYLGTLIRTRKLDFLLRVHAIVLERHPTAQLIFIGKGEMPEDIELLKDTARDLGIDHAVEFTGHLPLKDAWELAGRATIGVSPYFPTPILNSTSPTKLIEYMAMGLPVVANDHPEQRSVLSDSGAGFCVPWCEIEFANAIVKLLDNPTEADKMGERGSAWVGANRTNTVVVRKVEEQYFHILEGTLRHLNRDLGKT